MDNQFSYNELQVIFTALEAQLDLLRTHRGDDLDPEDRTKLLDAMKLTRSAKKKIGLLLQAAGKDLLP